MHTLVAMEVELVASPRVYASTMRGAANTNVLSDRRSDASEQLAVVNTATTSAASTQNTPSRQQIAETLQQLRAQEQTQREHELQRREAQDAFTKSIVKIMHLDTHDYESILSHTRTFVGLVCNEDGKRADPLRWMLSVLVQCERQHAQSLQANDTIVMLCCMTRDHDAAECDRTHTRADGSA